MRCILKVQNLKTATVGNDYVQQLVDGVIYYTGEPSVLHNQAKKAQKTAKKRMKSSSSSYDKDGPVIKNTKYIKVCSDNDLSKT